MEETESNDVPPVFQIGEKYTNRQISRTGATVIRPAVFQGGEDPKVITTSPCCPLNSRRLSFKDLLSVLGDSEGWTEKCTGCNAYYRVSLEYTNSPRLGLYGVRWAISEEVK